MKQTNRNLAFFPPLNNESFDLTLYRIICSFPADLKGDIDHIQNFNFEGDQFLFLDSPCYFIALAVTCYTNNTLFYEFNFYVVLDQANLTYVEIIRTTVAFWKKVGIRVGLIGNGHEVSLKDNENNVYFNRDVGICQISQN